MTAIMKKPITHFRLQMHTNKKNSSENNDPFSSNCKLLPDQLKRVYYSAYPHNNNGRGFVLPFI